MNVQKMKRQLARDVPDVTWLNVERFDPQEKIDEWRNRWGRMMRLKHGANLKDFTIFQSEINPITDLVRLQLVANLWEVKRNRLGTVSAPAKSVGGVR